MIKRDKITMPGRVTESLELEIQHDKWIDNELMTCRGEEVFVTLEPIRDRRTIQQNKYLFGVVYPMIIEHTGQDKDSLHDFFKAEFLTERFIMTDKDGVIIAERDIVRSSTRLRVMTFAEFIKKIQQFAGEHFHIEFDEAHP